MADKYSTFAHNSFRALNFDVRADKTSRYETGMNKGRSDLVLTKYGRGVFCEIKTGASSFNTQKWTPQQREWAEWATLQNGSGLYYFVIIGKHKPFNKKPYYAKVMLVPYPDFVALVNENEAAGKKSIPLKSTNRNTPTSLRGKGCDIETRWGKYALPWSEKVWTIPSDHPFYVYTIREILNGRIDSAA